MNWIIYVLTNPMIFVFALLLMTIIAVLIIKYVFRLNFFASIIIGLFVAILSGSLSVCLVRHYWSIPSTIPTIKNTKTNSSMSASLEIAALFDESKIHYEKKEYDKALSPLRKVVKIEPKHAEAYVKMAEIYLMKGQKDEAARYYDKAVHVKPDYAEAYRLRAMLYIVNNQYKNAIDSLTKAIEFEPAYHVSYLNRSVLYKKMGQNDMADSDLKKGIDLYFDKATAYMDYGYTCMMFDLREDAIIGFSKSIEAAPNRPWGYSQRGEIYYHTGKTEQAIADYKTAANLGDKTAQTFLKSKGITW